MTTFSSPDAVLLRLFQKLWVLQAENRIRDRLYHLLRYRALFKSGNLRRSPDLPVYVDTN
jgi:hypothetical protein